MSFLPRRGQFWWQLRVLPEMFSKYRAELVDRRETYRRGASWGGVVTLSFTVRALFLIPCSLLGAWPSVLLSAPGFYFFLQVSDRSPLQNSPVKVLK